MRYYGMNNQDNNQKEPQMTASSNYMEMPQNQQMDYPNAMAENTDDEQFWEATPKTPPVQTENRTFNRTNGNGIYKGQQAQNVRPVQDISNNFPPATFPPDSNPQSMGLQNATVYEYPAPQDHAMVHDIMEKACPSPMTQISFLCAHRGKVVKVEMGNGVTRSGILRNINPTYIVLEEKGSGNHIMCTMNAIKSIDIFV